MTNKNVFCFILMQNKNLGPTEIRTRVKGFKVLCANHYTMEPHNHGTDV
jgi:hypothetical protein